MTCLQRLAFAILVAVFASGVTAAEPAATAPGIPLCPGLTIVTAVSQTNGDYESIKTIESVGPEAVTLKYSAEYKNTGLLASGPPLKKLTLHRTMLNVDLQSATSYQQSFFEKSAETIPGTTSIGTSAAVLRALKTKGVAGLTYSNAYSGLELAADRNKHPNYYEYMQAGKLQRVGTAPTRFSVLVNDRLVELPAIQAQGDFVGDKAEFFFLDDERNPLTLAFRIGIGGIKPLDEAALSFCETLRKAGTSEDDMTSMHCDRPKGGDRDVLRVIKITYHCAAPAAQPAAGAGQGPGGGQGAGPAVAGSAGSAIEQALASGGKADVYSIYFSFNSDLIREESESTLREIAEILRRHPEWKLLVSGHTDNVGNDQYNLELSKRRSAAVKDALVKRYAIAATRLATSGFGRSQPKDTNDTLEGRARNRRVELVRQ